MAARQKTLGPANNTSLQVTQELTALLYAEEPKSIGPVLPAFLDGVFNGPPPEDPEYVPIWESGALAAELMQLGGQQ
jgi:hypothetical protein